MQISYFCLHDLPYFRDLNKETFSLVCRATSKLQLKKGEILFRQGDQADAVYIIKDGTLKAVRLTAEGEEAILHIIGIGETIGESALFRKGMLHPFTAVALEEVKVCSIARATFRQLLRANPEMAIQLIETLGERLYSAWGQMADFNSQTTEEKVLGTLIQLARQHGEHHHQGIKIKLKLTQEELASIVGASRVMVSHAITELLKRGSISRESRQYIVHMCCF